MLPRVILHNAISVDGRIDWFKPDIRQYYRLIDTWKEDATLAGNRTIFNPKDKYPKERKQAFTPLKIEPNDKRPLLVVPDSRGRIRNWHFLRKWPFWRNLVALITKSTPKTYIKYLEKRFVDYIITGKEKVNLHAALHKLNKIYGVKTVRVDSGGTLNGILLRSGLVDEISFLIHPCLVGGITPKTIFQAPDLTSAKGVIKLRLNHFKKLKNNIIWLRYKVVKKGG